MLLHSDMDLFADVISLTAQRIGQAQDIVEKDYYVTMILKKLSGCKYPVCFKGGTSLSKAYGIIERFSEDIDIAFTEHIGESRRKKFKYDILGAISEELKLNIVNWDKTESDKDYNHYDYLYNSIVKDPFINTYVKLETAYMSCAFPVENKEINNYIYLALKDDEPGLIVQYGLEPFTMKVQSLNRTFVDKIFAICDYYFKGKPSRNSRHLYDIYKLSEVIKVDEALKELITEVRVVRQKMKNEIAPAAEGDVDIKTVIREICDKEFYKEDYEMVTKNLVSDGISYQEVKDKMLLLAEKLF